MNTRFYSFVCAIILLMMTVGISSASDIVSAGKGGVWSADTTWIGGIVPGPGDNVIIANRDTITYDLDSSQIANLTVGQGDSTALRTTRLKSTILTVTGNIFVSALASFKVQSRDTTSVGDVIHKIYLYGDFTSNGVFDMRNGSTSTFPQTVSVINVYFVGNQNSTVTVSVPFTISTAEFNSVFIEKTGGANLVLGSNMYLSGGSTTAPLHNSILTFVSGKVVTGNYAIVHLGTNSSQIVGTNDSCYVLGALGRGISTSGGGSKYYPVGDEFGFRPSRIVTSATGGATGHHVIVRAIHGNANTGSSVLDPSLDRLSAIRYYKVTYRTVIGTGSGIPNATIPVTAISAAYGTDDGVRSGNTNLRVAYSINDRANWTKFDMSKSHTVNLNMVDSLHRIVSDTLFTDHIVLDTLSAAAYVALADTGNVNPLDGTVGDFSIDHNSLNFGNVNLAQTKWDSVLVTNLGTGTLTIRSHSEIDTLEYETTPVAPIVIAPSASQILRIRFTPQAVGARNSYILLYHDAPHNPDTLFVYGNGIAYDTMQLSYSAKWNLVSVPVTVDNYSKDSLFRHSLSTAYRYQAGYVVSPTLVIGTGYWLKYAAASSETIIGNDVTLDTIAVQDGWNLVGALSKPVATASVTSIGTTVLSSFYGYGNGYQIADSLQPGHGYWVKVSTAGSIVVSSASSAPKSGRSDGSLNDLNKLIIRDAAGYTQTLFFGTTTPDNQARLNRAFEMPPAAPAGTFDARFSSQSLVGIRSGNEDVVLPVSLSGASYPVNVSWELRGPNAGSTLLIGNKQQGMASNGTAVITGGSGRVAISISSSIESPKSFALGQNYPNPFNPSTKISFELPQSAVVTLTVFNLLGQEITSVVTNQMFAAGRHELGFSSESMSSGVYLYKLTAFSIALANSGSTELFSSTKKMILMK